MHLSRGSAVNQITEDTQVNESKVEDIDEDFTVNKTATVRYTNADGDIVHEEVSMDLPYNLKGETWEVFKKRGVSLLGGIGSSQIAQLMEQQLELRGVDLQMQIDPNCTPFYQT